MKHLCGVLALQACLLASSAAATDPSPQPTKASKEHPSKGRSSSSQDKASTSQVPDLPVEQYRLENGLTVLLSEDHQVPAVAVEVVYLVGSGHEREGRTGFAHLFEHLMFQGSAHYNQEYFTPYVPIGAEVNGTTNQDRTNYYELVPSQYAELPLWLESDRMRSLDEVLTPQKLNNQRDVVRNERRQRYENTPYGMAFWHMAEALYPPGHPYHHTAIGSHEDLAAATLEDVRAFFKKYYVPSNAALVIVGDFQPQEMRALIKKYFADISGGSRAPAPEAKTPELENPKHWVIQDEVELPRVYYAWHTPALFEPGDAELDLLSSVLTKGKSSRLFHSLVYEKKLAKDIAAFQISRKLSGVYVIEATAAPGTDLEELAQALETQLDQALSTPPTPQELARAKNAYKKTFFQRMEGYSSRASLLGSYFLFTGSGDYLDADYERYVSATPLGVQRAGKKYLDMDQVVRLDFIPGQKDAPIEKLSKTATSNASPKTERKKQ